MSVWRIKLRVPSQHLISSSHQGRVQRSGTQHAARWVLFPYPLFRMATKKSKTDVAGTASPAQEPAAKDAATASTDAKRRPVTVVRTDDCSASIWRREHVVQGKPRAFYSVTIERSFKDRDGAWRYTRSFDPDSLGKVVAVCQQASAAIEGLLERDAARQPEAAAK